MKRWRLRSGTVRRSSWCSPIWAWPAPISSKPDCFGIRCCRCSFRGGPNNSSGPLQFPFDVLWQRPRRVAAAQLNLESVSQRLVWDGLTLVADVRSAFADSVIAERRLALAGESAVLTRRVADLTESRLRAGDISDLEARGARSDAARIDVLRKSTEYDRDLAGLTLIGIIGLDPAALPIRMIPRRAVLVLDERQSLPGSARLAA